MTTTTSQADARLVNLLGAAATGITDAVAGAITAVPDIDISTATALVALLDFAPSASVRRLSNVLGLTHSGAVRVADRLVASGYAVRGTALGDERVVSLRLTPPGKRVAVRLRRNRDAAIRVLLEDLNTVSRRQLVEALERLIGTISATRLVERTAGGVPRGGALCRLCDFAACGRPLGRCPAAESVKIAS